MFTKSIKIFLSFFLLGVFFWPSISMAAGTKKLGELCSNNDDCISGDCEEDYTNMRAFCDCDDDQDCANAYGSNESWTCENGTLSSFDLDYCVGSNGTTNFPVSINDLTVLPGLFTKKFGDLCTNNAQCISNDCESSNFAAQFCDCASDSDCEREYGLLPGETWKCVDGTTDSLDIDYCQSNKRGTLYAIDPQISSNLQKQAKEEYLALIEFGKAPFLPVLKEACNLQDIKYAAGEDIYVPWIANCVTAVYKYGVILGSAVAVIFIMIGGVMMLSAGMKSEYFNTGKDYIYKSIFGLVILVTSYLILQLINPRLTELPSIKIESVEMETLDIIQAPAPEINQTPLANIEGKVSIPKSQRTQYLQSISKDINAGIYINGKFGFPNLYQAPPDGSGARYAQINPIMKDDLMKALEEIEQTTSYKIRVIGGFRCSTSAKTRNFATQCKTKQCFNSCLEDCKSGNMHACGLAIDINPGENPDCPEQTKEKYNLGVGKKWDRDALDTITQEEWDTCLAGGQITDIPKKVVDIFEKYGFYWGGNGWGNPNRSDAMHFEYHKYGF